MYKVLLVENEKHLRDWYKEELEEDGFDILLASTGKEALQRIKEDSVDLAVLDIKLRGMSGLEVLEKVVGERRKVPAIIHSAYPQYKDNFWSWAAEEFIVKSSDLSELKEAIQRTLRKCSKEKETEAA